MAGYFVVKYLGKKDLRLEGSGNVGARNAGRVHGKASFILTFLGDAMKGAFIVLAGKYIGFTPEIILTGLAFTIFGHLKPITLNFKGGMGISTFIGGMIAFDPSLAAVIAITFIVLYPFLKSFTFAGLGSFLAIPFALYLKGASPLILMITVFFIMIILFVHRMDIKQRLDIRAARK